MKKKFDYETKIIQLEKEAEEELEEEEREMIEPFLYKTEQDLMHSERLKRLQLTRITFDIDIYKKNDFHREIWDKATMSQFFNWCVDEFLAKRLVFPKNIPKQYNLHKKKWKSYYAFDKGQ